MWPGDLDINNTPGIKTFDKLTITNTSESLQRAYHTSSKLNKVPFYRYETFPRTARKCDAVQYYSLVHVTMDTKATSTRATFALGTSEMEKSLA
ncbi:hypothetical protein Pmani_031808 [Petrolisthes manimaculis]|uniref:Uncharacterized protein n=1 Tax=Petrolisthes manimaculis TaxID=1843537 RepID=A0AAE1NTX0_9EUCA|nr:hypothetical protein Pmani_031808 [Petrolisthes manimaculis]